MQKEIQDPNRSKSAKRSIGLGMKPNTAAIYLRKSSEEDNHSRADQLFDCEKRAEETPVRRGLDDQVAASSTSRGGWSRAALNVLW